VLGEGTACIYRYALASGVVSDGPTEVTFTCPAARDVDEPGGQFAVYSAPALDGVAAQRPDATRFA
jgi:hypothetical protein